MAANSGYVAITHKTRSPMISSSQDEECCEEKEDDDWLEDENPITERSVQGWSWALLVSGISSAMLFYCLDKSVVTILIPVIVGELGEASKLPWVFVGFGFGSLSLALPIGKIYTLFDAKVLYLGFLAIFILGSAICGAAWSMDSLIFGRVLAGIGGIGVYTGIMTILTVLTTEKERPIYLGVVGLFWSIGRVVGPLFGGLLGKELWRWAFYINLIVCGLFFPVYVRLLPNSPSSKDQPVSRRFLQFDPLGVLLNILSILSIITTINFGGTRFPWISPQIMFFFGAAAIFTVLFGIQQAKCFATTPESRIFPVKMIFNRKMCLVFVISATSGIAGFLPANFISLYFQFTQGDDPLHAAYRLFPMIITMSLVMPISGYLVPKIGNLERWPVIGGLVALPGSIMMVQLVSTSDPRIVYISEVLIGAGMGCYMQIPYTIIESYIEKTEKKDGMSFVIISQIGGIAFSMSISSAIYTCLAMQWLKDYLVGTPLSEIEGIISGKSGNLLAHLPTEQIPRVLELLVEAMIPAWVIVLVAILAGLGASAILCHSVGVSPELCDEQ